MPQLIPAISLWQPWASLYLTPFKPDETRHWPLPPGKVGQTVAIHGALRPIPRAALSHDLVRICNAAFGEGWFHTLPRGAMIGTVRLEASRKILSGMADAGACANYICGDWTPGRYAWPGADKTVFATPIPTVGRQGFFTFDLALATPEAEHV